MAAQRRERLTITLRSDLLPTIDATIDGSRIRNRSHAIEYLIQSALKPKSRRALILAGGKGVHMRPLTYEMPKAMLPVKGRPILEYTIERLRNADIRDILILVGHLGEKIREHFGDGERFGVKIRYIEEKVEEGTAAPLRLAAPHLKGQPFLLIYGDTLIDLDLADLVKSHAESGALATIALTSAENPSEFGVVRMHGDRIVEFLQKPPRRAQLSHLIFTGVGVLSTEVIDLIPKRGPAMLETHVFPKLAEQKNLAGYVFEGQWFDIGTPEAYEQALKEWGA